MNKNNFIKILSKTLGRKIDDNKRFELDSLDILKVVEMNNIHFKKLKIDGAKIMNCQNYKELVKIYSKEID
tara:strand:+ start:318 stop:530 length:213 start_codon:yes stop_codon:yes gene_type:complete